MQLWVESIRIPHMSNTDLTKASNSLLDPGSKAASLKRAKSFQVKTENLNYEQYAKTIRAYALAGMPFEHIANAGDLLGDLVERKEIDAVFENSFQSKVGEVAESDEQIMAWQARGERIAVIHQLSGPAGSGKEVVVASESLTTVDKNKQETIEVLEGINVSKAEVKALPEQTDNNQLENNPFLKAPALQDNK